MTYKVYKMSDKEYAQIMERMRQRNLKAAQSSFANAVRPWHNIPTTEISRKTGLCPSTVLRYKRGKWGSRGPMYTTYLALIRGRE